MEYLPLLISVSNESGAWSPNLTYSEPFDTLERFGLYIMSYPFSICQEPQNIISQTWKDQNGDDVFIPNVVTHKSDEIDVMFLYYHMDNMANVQINEFVKTIKGKWLKMYETYTGIGRQGVYFVGCQKAEKFIRRGERDTVIMKFKFKVNDPDTNITL